MSFRLWCSRLWSIVRYAFSTALMIFILGLVIRAIILKRTTFWKDVPWPLSLTLYFTLIVILAALEGLQVAIVELAKISPESYREAHPRAYAIAVASQREHVLERFLMGRQFLVVFIVFFLARFSTFHDPLFPTWLNSYLFKTGLLGAVLVVIIGNLPPQIYAADYPNRYNSIPGLIYFLYACLAVEWTGIIHAAWLLPWLYVRAERLVRRICCCQCSDGDVTRGGHDMTEDGTNNVCVDPDRVYLIPFPRAVSTLLQGTGEPLPEEALQVAMYASYFSKYKLTRPRAHEQNGPIVMPFRAASEDFYEHPSSFGELEYASPGEISQHLLSAGIQPPAFLLPPTDPKHVPPHIVACRLLASLDLLLHARRLRTSSTHDLHQQVHH